MKHTKIHTGGGLAMASLLGTTLWYSPQQVQAVALEWDASTDATVRGYYVYHGTVSNVYTNKTDAGTNTLFTLSGLVPRSTNYFTATSYNAARVESVDAMQVSYIDSGNSSSQPPTVLAVTHTEVATLIVAAPIPSAPTSPFAGVTTSVVAAPTPVMINCPVVLDDGSIRLPFMGGEAGVSYEVQGSTDLSNWSTLTNLVAGTNGLSSYLDLSAVKLGLRFYRTVTP